IPVAGRDGAQHRARDLPPGGVRHSPRRDRSRDGARLRAVQPPAARTARGRRRVKIVGARERRRRMQGQQHTRRKLWLGGLGLAALVAAGAATAALAAGSGHQSVAKHSVDTKTLIVAVPSDIQNLDPTLSSADVVTQEMLTNVYDWLIDYKVGTQNGQAVGEPNQFVGAIAKSFSWNAAKTEVTFHLRPGVKFANGDPLDANAVKFPYDRIFDQNGVTAALTGMAAVAGKSSITVVNPTTVKFKLKQANTLLFGNMAQFGHSILDPKVVQEHATAKDKFA